MTLQRLEDILKRASEKPHNITREEMVSLLSIEEENLLSIMYAASYKLKQKYCGNFVNLRGLIEISNICAKNCFYCGIRRDNKNVERFRLSREQILHTAEFIYKSGYGSIVLQGGEIEGDANTSFIEDVLREITKLSNGELGITLSLGEQTREVYKRWREAGAHRYLIRIEESNKEFYKTIHPADHDFDRRVKCLKVLRELNYQVGTGVMIGMPNQTLEMLADDVIFFKNCDIDMIGMGPYIPHHDTPLGKDIQLTSEYSRQHVQLGLKMIAVTRLFLHDVNIASTTALQALDKRGRELGILAGANVIMPNATDVEYRPSYQLYDNKPAQNENAEQSKIALEKSLESIGESINYNKRGDSLHYKNRQI